MPTKLSLLLCFVTITILSACSFTKQTQVSKSHSKATSEATSLTFIDNISIDQDGSPSSHEVTAYHSPKIETLNIDHSISPIQLKYASLLDVSPSEVISDTALLSFIDDWMGTPYRYGGESRSGIDCSAFVQILYSIVFGITTLPRTAQEQYDDSRKIKRIKRLKPGDLVFFRIHSRRISHVGVYLQNNKFVNASLSSGVTISDLTNSYWKRYFVCGGKPKELKYNPALAMEGL